MPRKKQDRNVTRARRLRKEMPLPQVLLWQILRKEPDGVKLRREHSLGDYYLDFYCAKTRTCFEIDGFAHATGDRPQRDEQRDACLREHGIEVVRIPASEVLRSPADVAEAMVRYCKRS